MTDNEIKEECLQESGIDLGRYSHSELTEIKDALRRYHKSKLKLLGITNVVSSLPTSKDRMLELEKAIIRWDLKNNTNDKQAFSCGWNNCYRWMKDFVRENLNN